MMPGIPEFRKESHPERAQDKKANFTPSEFLRHDGPGTLRHYDSHQEEVKWLTRQTL
jgi:hypothetical protein